MNNLKLFWHILIHVNQNYINFKKEKNLTPIKSNNKPPFKYLNLKLNNVSKIQKITKYIYSNPILTKI